MAIDTSLSQAKLLAARKANDIIEVQINTKAPTVKALKRADLAGMVYNVNLRDGILGSVGVISDGGTYPTGSNVGYEQIQVVPNLFIANVQIPLLHSITVAGAKDSPDSVLEQIEAAGDALSWLMEGFVLDGYVGAVSTGDASGTTHSLVCTGYSLRQVKAGQQVDVWDTSGAALFAGTFTVSSLNRATGAIVLASSGTVDIDAGDIIYLKGFRGSRFASLADAAGSDDLYGTTITGASFGWSGQTASAGGAITEDLVADLATEVYDGSGDTADLFVMSPKQHRNLRQDMVATGRRFLDSAMDSFGNDFENSKVMGQKIVVSPACPDTKVFALNKDAVKLGRFHSGEVMNLNVSRKDFDYDSNSANVDIKRGVPANVVVRKRSAVGVLSGITF